MSDAPPGPSGLALASIASGALGLAALASVVFGVSVGVLSVPGLALPVVSVVTGGLALRRPAAPGDRGLARAGVALGALGVLGLVGLALIVAVLSNMGAHH